MSENPVDHQHCLPPLENFFRAGEYFSSKEKTEFRYTFSPRADVLANKVKSKMFEAAMEETADFYAFPQKRYIDTKWEGIINYLRSQGFIRDITLDTNFNDEINLYFFDIFSPLDRSLTDGHSPQYAGYSRGVSENYNEAVSKVIGEFLERYPLLLYKNKNLVRSSISSLKKSGKKFLDPRDLSEFSEEQKKNRAELNFNERSVFSWVKGKSLVDDKEALIPAQLVFWTYCRHKEDGLEPLLREANTNGAGGNFSRDGAILSGLYECIQRDSFFIHWFSKLSPRKIDNATISDPSIKKLLQKAERLNFEVHFLDITSDIKIPAAVAIIVDNTGVGPKIALGGGCGSDPSKVLERAMTEACGLYHWIRKKPVQFGLPENYKSFITGSIGQLERLRLWGNSDMFSNLEFLFKGSSETYDNFILKGKSFTNEKEELEWAVKEVSKFGKGYEPFYYISSHPLLDELGYFSAKLIIPKLIPLYLNEINAPAGAKRISESIINMGLKPVEDINHWPHPFP